MGTIEPDYRAGCIHIHSAFITYGGAADFAITRQIAAETEMMWNDAAARIYWKNRLYDVRFHITAQYNSLLQPDTVTQNRQPKHNFIRIEDYAHRNISVMDAVGSNTGYFLRDNLYPGSTTAAHEYGHSLGLPHPADLNIVGKGIPGIMYPRGTLVSPEFQYDPKVRPGEGGGTLNPVFRKVRQQDIDLLDIAGWLEKDRYVLGKFTNKYHEVQVREKRE
jgi:hypothetical protein